MTLTMQDDIARAQIDRSRLLHLLREMIRIRRFEEKCAELYTETKIRGFLHLYNGEEAVAVGVMEHLTPDDAVVATYREHGHALARGIAPGVIMAEMYGRMEGCSRGRGGSMHLFDAATHFYGGNAIVGGAIPLAVGLALADSMRRRSNLTCCFFGDGAVAEGEFHESMNLAALWKLPVLFVCENNLYAMGTAYARSESVTDLVGKSAGYGIPAVSIDGMDVIAVSEATKVAVDHVRSGAGPYLLECRTYRFRAHSMYDPELYRAKEEVDQWKRRDPIALLLKQGIDTGVVRQDDVDVIERSVADEIAEAIAYAEAGRLEPIEDLELFVYSPRSGPEQDNGNG